MAEDRSSFAIRSGQKLRFDNLDLDYYLTWLAGREVYGGSLRSECMDAADRITSEDAGSWHREWLSLAEAAKTDAHTARSRGAEDQSRGAYLRACSYYRAPLFIMNPRDPEFWRIWEEMTACFRIAATLSSPQIEHVQVPFGRHSLDGYFWKVDESGQRRPTLIVIGGIETFAEDCYFMIGQSGPQRGYNVLTIDLPGQGTTPRKGLYFGARTERFLGPILNHASARSDVDSDRIAAVGFSWGGHIVMRGARYDQRIKAAIANPPMPNVFRSVLAQQKGQDRRDPITRMVFQQVAWRMGLRVSLKPLDIVRRIGKAYDYLMNGRIDPRRITIPTLLMAGAGEAQVTLQIARECYAQLPHPDRKLVIFTKEQGSEAHCQVDNLPLANEVIFDWLDEVFA